MRPSLAIGVGCRRGCPGAAIRAVIDAACAGLDLSAAELFTHATKRDDLGLREAATSLGLPLNFLPPEDLAAVTDRVHHRSVRVEAALGLPSVAEAAALAGAGPGGRLVVSRVSHPQATCAVAIGAGA